MAVAAISAASATPSDPAAARSRAPSSAPPRISFAVTPALDSSSMPCAASVAEKAVRVPASSAASRRSSMVSAVACVAARDSAHGLVEVGEALHRHAEPGRDDRAGSDRRTPELLGRLGALASVGLLDAGGILLGLDPHARDVRDRVGLPLVGGALVRLRLRAQPRDVRDRSRLAVLGLLQLALEDLGRRLGGLGRLREAGRVAVDPDDEVARSHRQRLPSSSSCRGTRARRPRGRVTLSACGSSTCSVCCSACSCCTPSSARACSTRCGAYEVNKAERRVTTAGP